jgi:hypothetical protein
MHTSYVKPNENSVNQTISSRVIGALFLSAIVFYGVGFGLATSVVSRPGFLSAVPTHQTTLALGAFLMLLNSVVVVGIGVLLFPILENYSKRTALAYLVSRTIEAVLLAIGVLCLLMTLPLARQAASADVLGSLAVQANAISYQIAMMSLGLGGVLLCSLLYRTQLIPRLLAVWGVIGYAIFLAGAVAEIFGIHLGLMLSIPGGLFELGLGIWLLIKGFESAAVPVARLAEVAAA